MRRLAFFVTLLLLAPAGCGGGGPGPERADVLGDGSWSGARTAKDGREVLVVFTGGPEYEEGNSCTVSYRAEATETASIVRVRIFARSPSGGGGDCDDLGYQRSVSVVLDRPFGERRLIEEQFDREQPVFDGSALAEVTWLAQDLEPAPEGPGFPDPQLSRYWQRSWYPPEREPTGGRCTPGPAGVSLTEGPADLAQRSPNNSGERPTATYTVRQAEANYAVNRRGSRARLTWAEGERGFLLESNGGCEGDTSAPPEVLVRIARSLRLL